VDADNANFPAGYPADTLFHPTFLYESLWNIAGVLILLALDRRFHFRRGRLFWLYAMYYTLGRVWIEAMRIDDAEQISLFGITTRLNVWTSIFVFVAALAVFIVLGRRKDGNADTVYLPGREPAAVAAAPNVTAQPVRDTDDVVSDSESRDNLPDNQNGSGLASAQTEAVPASTGGTPTAAESRNTGKPGGTDTGAAPEADSSR
jgi:hypothetical protein